MKKYLFFGTALFLAVGSYAQNAKSAKPSGVLDTPLELKDFTEPTGQNSNVFVGPTKKIKHVVSTNKVASATNFTGSMNVLGYLVSQSKPLHYTKGINAVSFVARKSTTYTASSNSNSGTIVGLYSTNFGSTWDETCLWSNGNNLARYPQGGIYNPLGNTNINNAYLVGMGPFTSGTPTWGGPTNGQWYASKQITTPGNTTSGPDQQSNYYVGGFLKKHYMPRNSFSAIDGGLIRSMANIVNDPDNTSSNLGFGLRGALMSKGQFNAGSFVWSVDSFVPPVNSRTDGSKLIGTSSPIQAWDEAGVVGYVITLGSRSGTNLAMKGHQPIVYKTTNGGISWSLLPANDFTDPVNFTGVWDRTYPVNNNTVVTIANFQGTEGMDAVVDMNGQLHIAAMVYGHYYAHNDSLGYRYVFGAEQYSYPENGPFGYPIIYDFYTTATGWDYHMVDSMGTEGPSDQVGQPGYTSNPWTSATAKYSSDARIQMSRSADGSKLFYSWTESDSTVVGLKWNIYPDIKMKGYDITTNKVSGRMNITTGVTGADQQAYWHYMSSKSAATGTCQTIPYTITYNGTNNGDIQVDTYYLDGIQVCNSDYLFNPLSPKGLGAGVTAANSVNYEVGNYPNPANDMTTIMVGLKDASYFEVAIYNSIGQLMNTYRLNGQVGANPINVDLSSFSAGVYFYNVKVGSSVVTKKLIVQ
jgi:hypothetical protein